MNQVFVTNSKKPLPRWLSAFPELRLSGGGLDLSVDELIWLDKATLGESLAAHVHELQAKGFKFVVLDAVPSDDQALRMVQSGASGYAHRQANSIQLQEIALVVANGGLWCGPALLQQVVMAANTVSAEVAKYNGESQQAAGDADKSKLTERELAVAGEVGKGSSNKEIAEALSITERTVKAHLSVVFEKLMVRDRVQLALLMNGIKV